MNKVSILNAVFWVVFAVMNHAAAQYPAYLKLEFDKNQKPYVFYPVIKGDNQESLCKTFGCSINELRARNKLSSGQSLAAGKTLQIPVSPDVIIKKNIKGKYDGVLPVFYTVKKGETAYRIVKVNLKDDVQNFCERNKLENCQLKVGSDVQVGWIDVRNNKSSADPVLSASKSREDKKSIRLVSAKTSGNNDEDQPTVFKKIVSEKSNAGEAAGDAMNVENENTETWVSDRGVAYWQHGHRANTHKYVLHNSAEINSIIELYNPMLKRTVRAKVIGRIPGETYRDDIDVVLSSGAAESLGALDSRFQVEMRYKKSN